MIDCKYITSNGVCKIKTDTNTNGIIYYCKKLIRHPRLNPDLEKCEYDEELQRIK